MVKTLERIVLTEKSPFWVKVSRIDCPSYGIELLVRPCLSEKEIEILYENNELNRMVAEEGEEIKEFKNYYIILKGGNFSYNIVQKNICERIKK